MTAEVIVPVWLMVVIGLVAGSISSLIGFYFGSVYIGKHER